MISASGPPRCGINCKTPANIAQNGAHGMPMIHNPTSHISATASASWHWAINQFLRSEPVVRTCERQSCQSAIVRPVYRLKKEPSALGTQHSVPEVFKRLIRG